MPKKKPHPDKPADKPVLPPIVDANDEVVG
jgi:hypothetical protein